MSWVPDDSRGGYRYGLEDAGFAFPKGEGVDQKGGGFDFRWSAPVEGLTAGYSRFMTTASAKMNFSVYGGLPVTLDLSDWNRDAIYGDFQKNQWRFSAEWRREAVQTELPELGTPGSFIDSRSWFVMGSYRVNKNVDAYGGLSLSKLDGVIEFPGGGDVDFENGNTFGIFGGFDLKPSPNFTVGVELRLVNETAFGVTGRFKF